MYGDWTWVPSRQCGQLQLLRILCNGSRWYFGNQRTVSCNSRDEMFTKAWTRTLVASPYRYFQVCLMEYRSRKALLQTLLTWMLRFCIVYLESASDHPSLNVNHTTVSVKIVGTLCYLLALPMLMCHIWWVDCDKHIGTTRRRTEVKISVGWKGPNHFCLRMKLGLLWAHHVEEMSKIAWRTNAAGYHLHTYRYWVGGS